MTAKFLIGAFAILVILSLVIVGILRGFNFSKTTKITNNKVPLPVVSNSTPSAIPATSTAPQTSGVKAYNNGELNLSFTFPQKFSLNAVKKPATRAFPLLAYEFTFMSTAPAAASTSGFGMFMAPHSAGQSLTDILNQQNQIASVNGQTPASFTTVNRFGNSLETAKFTAGSPSLYAIRTTNNVYYIYNLSSSGTDQINLDSILATLQFADVPSTPQGS